MNRNSEQTEPSGREIRRPADLDPIHEIAVPLIGQVCWMVEFTYPNVLNLHWGPAVTYSTPLGEEQKGTWILHAFGSEWVIRCADGAVVRSSDEEKSSREGAKILEGATTTSFDATFPDLNLQVGFDNGCLLRLSPEEDGPEESGQGEGELE